jgi:hypothetical protein
MSVPFKEIVVYNDEKNNTVLIFIDGRNVSTWSYDKIAKYAPIFFEVVSSFIKDKILALLEEYKMKQVLKESEKQGLQ